MDIEKLTKQQIILVTLLVSFVTSIATGIVTVALMDQAPPGVTQTINRVVERTVEKVVTPPTTGNSAAVITRETVIVKEDDQVTEAIEKNKNSVVRIYTDNNDPDDRIFVGLGTIVSKDGLIVTGEVFADARGRYIVTVDGTNFYKVAVLPQKDDHQLYFLRVNQKTEAPIEFVPVTLGNSSTLKLGQAIITIGGVNRNSVATGIISSLVDNNPVGTSTPEIIGLSSTVSSAETLAGGPMFNLSGEMIGLRVSANIAYDFNFIPANEIKREIASL